MNGQQPPPWQQKIFFGPPGCGKSYRVREEAREKLGIDKDNGEQRRYFIETTFHPEYSYGDFVAKLLPQTKKDGGIEYRIHPGPLIRALALAYAEPKKSVVLVIDEINRGNCAQIFGDIFQLLDRDDSGWSQYGIDASNLTVDALLEEMGEKAAKLDDLKQIVAKRMSDKRGYKLRLPPNLSIFGTMNTSDESVYYMDTAFKRRWDFQYMPWDDANALGRQKEALIGIDGKKTWHELLNWINSFIAETYDAPAIDDKLIGIWFIKSKPQDPEGVIKLRGALEKLKGKQLKTDWVQYFPSADHVQIGEFAPSADVKCISIKIDIEDIYGVKLDDKSFSCQPNKLAGNLLSTINKLGERVNVKSYIALEAIRDKLLFFLWDNVFSQDRSPLFELLKKGGYTFDKPPRTFGEFAEQVDAFIKGVINWNTVQAPTPTSDAPN